jgi:hypothetical protein
MLGRLNTEWLARMPTDALLSDGNELIEATVGSGSPGDVLSSILVLLDVSI